MELEVAVEIGDRAERRRGDGALEGGKLAGQAGYPGLVVTEATRVGARGLERREAPHPLLLFRAGERIAAAFEDPVEGVVVAGADRIELVIVAAGAAEAQGHDRLPHRVDRVLDREVVVLFRIEAEAARDREKPSGRHALGIRLGRSLRGEDIAGDLLAEKLVVGEIAVEGIDAVIAVAPSDRNGIVCRLAGGVGVANDVEPVARPSLAIGLGGEEPLDHLLEGIGRGVGKKRLDLRGRRWQAGEIEGRPADERATVGAGKGGDSRLFLPSANEAVDRRPTPRLVDDRRRGGISHRLEGPVSLDHEGRGHFRPERPGCDPTVERRHLFGKQGFVSLRGHRRHIPMTRNRLEEKAARRIARRDRGPRVAAADEGLARIDPQPP